MPVTATLSGQPLVSGQRHALLAIGSGFTGLTATKALKVSQMNLTDALVFVSRFVVQGSSRTFGQASHWTPAVPAVVTAIVLFVLSVVAVANIAKLIADQPNSGWSINPGRWTAASVYATTLYSVR